MVSNQIVGDVKRGLGRLWAVVLVGSWLALVLAGIAIAFTPSEHSRYVGYLLLALAAVWLTVSMDRWVKHLPGILACGAVGGIFTIVAGHSVNHPEVLVNRLQATIMTCLFVCSSVVAMSFDRQLTLVDRLALTAFVFLVFRDVAVGRQGISGLAIGVCLLGCSWAIDRFKRRPATHRPKSKCEL